MRFIVERAVMPVFAYYEGKPTRVGKEEVWAVNISSLKQPSDFSDKYGPLVFNSDRFDIYDDYIE